MSKLSHPSKSGQVGLSVDDAREIARLLGVMLGHLSESEDSDSGDSDFRSRLAPRARALFFERKRRTQHFNSAMFNEPAWDMLLALYITEVAGSRQSVGKLISWVGVPQTTALRWIAYLEKEHLVSRETDPVDRRIMYIDLTERGRDSLERYLATMNLAYVGM